MFTCIQLRAYRAIECFDLNWNQGETDSWAKVDGGFAGDVGFMFYILPAVMSGLPQQESVNVYHGKFTSACTFLCH